MSDKPISADLSIFAAMFASVAEEMGTLYCLSSLSPNIKERQDYSCGLFDNQSRMVVMAPHIPMHLGSMPSAVKSVMSFAPFSPGDLIILNDPYMSGTHLPDVTMVTPIFVDGHDTPAFFSVSRGHQADVGGTAPGSMGPARELVQEGMIIPPVRLYDAGELKDDVLRLILANVRTPEERWGDLRAQAAAHSVADQRIKELAGRFGVATCWQKMSELIDYTERMTRLAIARVPDGQYSFEDYMDDDGFGTKHIKIAVSITVKGSDLTVDFTGSSPLVEGGINATAAVTTSTVSYAVRCLLPRDVPANEGSMRPVHIVLPERCVVHAARPHAVAGSIETAQRIVDVLQGALGKALPNEMPAAGSGTMSNIMFGGWNTFKDEPFTYYETVAGGGGGNPIRPGADVLQAHMTNTLNTPIEMLEMTYPLRIHEYSVREGSGGEGKHQGGAGCRKAWESLVACTASFMGDRREGAPWGTLGGKPGSPGRNELVANDGTRRPIGSKAIVHLQPGDVIVMETPGGGGWGETVQQGAKD